MWFEVVGAALVWLQAPIDEELLPRPCACVFASRGAARATHPWPKLVAGMLRSSNGVEIVPPRFLRPSHGSEADQPSNVFYVLRCVRQAIDVQLVYVVSQPTIEIHISIILLLSLWCQPAIGSSNLRRQFPAPHSPVAPCMRPLVAPLCPHR